MSYDEERAWYGGSYNSEPEPPPPPRIEVTGPELELPSEWLKWAAASVEDVPKHEGPALVMGRFNPMHVGHAFLLQTAAKACGTVIVAIWTKLHDGLPWNDRAQAAHAALPFSRDHRVFMENPFEVRGTPDDPNFWAPWVKWFRQPAQQQRYGACRTLVSSDEKAKGFADAVGLRFLLVDPHRKNFPISATMVRAEPWKHWAHIAPGLRAPFAKVVALVGPEGAGKSWLSRQLGSHYGTAVAAEYLRTWATAEKREPTYEELSTTIASEQGSSFQRLVSRSKKFGFADTEGLTLELWSQRLFGKALSPHLLPPRAHFYLVVDDAPWNQAAERNQPEARVKFLAALREGLAKAPHAFISGPREGRLAQCIEAVDAWVATNPAKVDG